MDEKWQQLKDWINESDNIVFFGGAGVSTESGIPDFRSVDGLYNQKYKYKIRKSSTASIKTVCCFRMQNLMQPIKPLQNWNRKEN